MSSRSEQIEDRGWKVASLWLEFCGGPRTKGGEAHSPSRHVMRSLYTGPCHDVRLDLIHLMNGSCQHFFDMGCGRSSVLRPEFETVKGIIGFFPSNISNQHKVPSYLLSYTSNICLSPVLSAKSLAAN